MTSGLFGPKTSLTQGPEWLQGCSVQKRHWRGVPNDLLLFRNQFVDRKWFSKTALCESKTSLTASRQCASQKRHSRGVPFFKLREEKNSKQKWEEKKSQNLTEEGSRMTSGMFGPKTLPTRGPDWPQGCSVQKRYQRGVPNDFRDVRSKNVTNAGSRTTF